MDNDISGREKVFDGNLSLTRRPQEQDDEAAIKNSTMEDLDQKSHSRSHLVTNMADDHPEKVQRLHMLGMNLVDKHLVTASLGPINAAIECLQAALDLTPLGSPGRGTRLLSLANAYLHKCERNLNLTDMNTAIQRCSEGIDSALDDSLLRAKLLRVMGDAYCIRHIRSNDIADINEAIQHFQTGLDLALPDDITRFNLSYSLGKAYINRYQYTATLADLNMSNDLFQSACDSTPEGTDLKSSLRKSLAQGYQVKYLRTGETAHIVRAISLFKERIDHSTVEDPGFGSFYADLGVAYGVKQVKGGEMKDLETGIQFLQDAVNLSKPDDALYTWMLGELAKLYKNRFGETKATSDIDAAISNLQNAIEVCSDERQQATHLQWLSRATLDKFKETGSIADIKKSIQSMEECLEITTRHDHLGAGRLFELGSRYGDKYKVTKDANDFTVAAKHLEEVVYHGSCDAYFKVLAGKEAMELFALHKDWLRGYRIGSSLIEIVPSLIPRFLEPSDTQYVLRDIAGIACDAAAMSLNAGQEPGVALKLLEAGRDIMATSIEDLHGEVISLRSNYPELAEQFFTQRDALDKPATVDDEPNQRYERGNKFGELIDRIRQLPGFDDFLRIPSEEALKKAASEYPIVVINVSRHRCDAIVVVRDRIWSMPLLDMSLTKLRNQSPSRHSIGTREALSWLWEVAMKPILDSLGFVKTPALDEKWPRVCWIPTGPLCTYPLHAAGHHGDSSSQAVIDRVMSSYSSSIKAIINGRRPAITGMEVAGTRSMLVSVEDAPGATTLPFARREVEMLHGLLKSISLDPINPVCKQDIIAQLPGCSVFHFAGHGFTDEQDPSKSHLLLHENGQSDCLDVGTLLTMNLREKPPFLAYLSACGTGQSKDSILFDESIHLISAFRLAGFRHVIGTLWEVHDEYCIDIAKSTYEEIRGGGMTDSSVCRGLHVASRELRKHCFDMEMSRCEKQAREFRVRSTHHSDEGQAQRMSQRDILPCDEDFDLPFYWVPYVHFGV